MSQRAKSMQQKLGFMDDDLKSPKHDEMLKWIHENIEKIIYSLFDYKSWPNDYPGKVEQEVRQIVESNLQVARKVPYNEMEDEKLKRESRVEYLSNWQGLGTNIPARSGVRICEKMWEFPVTSQIENPRTNYKSPKNIVGYIDLKVSFAYTRLSVTGIDFNGNIPRVDGKIDWKQTEETYNYESKAFLTRTLLIEAKTRIDSLGELFRQLNTYKEYTQGDFLVICPDDTNKAIITEQGFLFYKYPH